MRRCSFHREISHELGHRDRRNIFSELSREIFARQEEIIGPIPAPSFVNPCTSKKGVYQITKNSIPHFLSWLFLTRCNRRTFTVVTYRQVYISLINWTTIGIGILKGKIYVTNWGSDNMYSRVNDDICKWKINFSVACIFWPWYSIVECQASNSFCFT